MQMDLELPPGASKPGSKASFQFVHSALGTLKRCRLAHDNTGPFPSWRVDKVEVVELSSGSMLSAASPVTFWFCRTIQSSDKSQLAYLDATYGTDAAPKKYRMSVWTSDCKGKLSSWGALRHAVAV
jgi:hypothetical protein